MATMEYLLTQKPWIRRLKKIKLAVFILLICVCGVLPTFLVDDLENSVAGILGEVMNDDY